LFFIIFLFFIFYLLFIIYYIRFFFELFQTFAAEAAGMNQARFSDKPPWLAATTNHENLNPANPVGL
jgi:hypothetical protein